MRDLIIIGGGGHARVVIEAARSVPAQWRVLGFVDPAPCHETQTRLNIPRLGGDEALALYPDAVIVLGLGNVDVNTRRQKIVAKLAAPSARWATIAHGAAYVSPTAAIGHGSVIMAGAAVNSGARIGDHCIVNSNAVIEHDVTIGAFVHASPASAVAGGATIGGDTYIGMGALVRDHITLGRGCLIGMGAVVTTSFGDGVTLVGLPAKETEKRN